MAAGDAGEDRRLDQVAGQGRGGVDRSHPFMVPGAARRHGRQAPDPAGALRPTTRIFLEQTVAEIGERRTMSDAPLTHLPLLPLLAMPVRLCHRAEFPDPRLESPGAQCEGELGELAGDSQVLRIEAAKRLHPRHVGH